MIDERKAGREIDARVAEEVMEWRPITHFHGEPIADGWVGFWDGDWFRWTTRPPSDEENASVEWKPSTQIADAWPVLERFDEYAIYKDEHRVVCKVAMKEDVWSMSIANTAPLAICLAALEAVEN